MTVNVAANSGVFLDWQQIHWPGVSDPAINGPQADPDRDGLANLAEFALGLPPTTPSAQPVSLTDIQPEMVVTYAKSRHAIGVNTFVEWSDLLTSASWSTEGVSAPVIVPPDIDPNLVEFRVTLPPGTDRRFTRLKITGQP
jgi:hypothetical protein